MTFADPDGYIWQIAQDLPWRPVGTVAGPARACDEARAGPLLPVLAA